jgi:hypothetical protein
MVQIELPTPYVVGAAGLEEPFSHAQRLRSGACPSVAANEQGRQRAGPPGRDIYASRSIELPKSYLGEPDHIWRGCRLEMATTGPYCGATEPSSPVAVSGRT